MSVRKERICVAKSCSKFEPILDGNDALMSELKLCSLCKVVRYCSKTCQKSDSKKHKNNCKSIANMEFSLTEAFSNTCQGWEPMEKRHVIASTRLYLADLTWQIAEEFQSWEAYQASLDYCLEIVSLDPGDNTVKDYPQAMKRIPFILMTLNRDEDAYKFIKYSCRARFYSKYHFEDWIWRLNANKLEDLATGDHCAGDYLPQPDVKLALIALKMKILNDLNDPNFVQFALELGKAPKHSVAEKILYCDLVMDCIQSYVLGHKLTKHDRVVRRDQEKQLQNYLDGINKENPNILLLVLKQCGIINPKLKKKYWNKSSQNKSSQQEAELIAKYAFSLFKGIPGALQKIEYFCMVTFTGTNRD